MGNYFYLLDSIQASTEYWGGGCISMALLLLINPLIGMALIWLFARRAIEVLYTALFFSIFNLIES